jgi:uncharacterized membrane protein YgcG
MYEPAIAQETNFSNRVAAGILSRPVEVRASTPALLEVNVNRKLYNNKNKGKLTDSEESKKPGSAGSSRNSSNGGGSSGGHSKEEK